LCTPFIPVAIFGPTRDFVNPFLPSRGYIFHKEAEKLIFFTSRLEEKFSTLVILLNEVPSCAAWQECYKMLKYPAYKVAKYRGLARREDVFKKIYNRLKKL
jgi:hypothetical protein